MEAVQRDLMKQVEDSGNAGQPGTGSIICRLDNPPPATPPATPPANTPPPSPGTETPQTTTPPAPNQSAADVARQATGPEFLEPLQSA